VLSSRANAKDLRFLGALEITPEVNKSGISGIATQPLMGEDRDKAEAQQRFPFTLTVKRKGVSFMAIGAYNYC
jgi:hypothetical protein